MAGSDNIAFYDGTDWVNLAPKGDPGLPGVPGPPGGSPITPMIIVTDVALIPLGTQAGTVVVVSPGGGEVPPPTYERPIVIRVGAPVGSNASTPFTIPVDKTGLQDGDALILALAAQGGSGMTEDVSIPGWDRIGPSFVPSSGLRYGTFWGKRVASAASEPSSLAINVATPVGWPSTRKLGVIFSVRSVDINMPVDVYSAFTTSSDNLHPVIAQVSPTRGRGLMLVLLHAVTTSGHTAQINSVPSGYTRMVDTATPDRLGTGSSDWMQVWSKQVDLGTHGGEILTYNDLSDLPPSISVDMNYSIVLGGAQH